MKELLGAPVAEQIYTSIQTRYPDFTRHLAIILIGEDPSSLVYIAKKQQALEHMEGTSKLYQLPIDSPSIEIENLIQALNQDPHVHGIIIQLPIPHTLDTRYLLSLIDPIKDVDGLTPKNLGQTLLGQTDHLLPATPSAVMALLRYYEIDLKGRHIALINNGILVGKPLVGMLTDLGATVTVCHRNTQNLADITQQCDIVVTAVGKPHLFDASYLKSGAIVIDVGISRDPEGNLCGDFDSISIQNTASAYTPVPGGVGPVTVACLMDNLYRSL